MGGIGEGGRLFEVGANSRLGAYSNKYGSLLSNIVLISLQLGSAVMRVDLFCRSTSLFALACKVIVLLCLIQQQDKDYKEMLSPQTTRNWIPLMTFHIFGQL